LNKIDNGLSIKPKRLINRMFSSILAVLFLIRLFHKSNFYTPWQILLLLLTTNSFLLM